MRIWFFSFVVMAPCVFLIGVPVCLLCYSAFKEYQSFNNQNPNVDSSFSILGVGFDAGGHEVLAGVVIASFFILFVVGVVLLFRSSINKQSESSQDEE